jgi:hypothetical protein
VIGLDKDEREDFLKRENELSDSLAEKESALVAADKLVKELREELAFLKEQEAAVNQVRIPTDLRVLHCILFEPFTGEQGDVQSAKRAKTAS